MTVTGSATVNRLIWVAAVILVSGFSLTACGKKGPPIPPKVIIPPPASNILLTRDKEQIALSWSIPDSLKVDEYHPWSAVIYRASRSLQETPCENCPLMFAKVAELPILQSDLENRKMTYEDGAKAGYRYWYKIVLVSDDGFSTEDSEAVSVEVPTL
jgi:predicted small lipoprotein YifL